MTGEFDENLKNRLLAFQEAHGLGGDGVADADTWRTLTAPTDPEALPTGDVKLKPGVCNHPDAACPEADNLDINDVIDLARNAGIPEKDVATAVAVAKAESGFDRCCRSSTGDVGVWQINQIHWKNYGGRDALYDTATNARAAHDLYKAGGNTFRHWKAFTSGSHEKHLAEAREAVRKHPRD
jgi:hypothetical protein